MEQLPKPVPNQAHNEFANFDAGLKRALSVSKEEMDRREEEWRKKQDEKPKRKAK